MMANGAKVEYRGVRLLGLFRGVGSSNRPLGDNTYPVVRCQKQCEGPSMYTYEGTSAGGRRQNRIRHLYRPSRIDNTQDKLKVATLSTQGLSWHNLGHRDKLRFLVQHMRNRQLDLLSLSEMHAMQGPSVVHLEEFVLVTNNHAGWLMTLPMYILWSCSKYRRWDGGDNVCAMQMAIQNRVYIFVSVYMRPSNLVRERRKALEELDKVRAQFPQAAVGILTGDFNAHAGSDFQGDAVLLLVFAVPDLKDN